MIDQLIYYFYAVECGIEDFTPWLINIGLMFVIGTVRWQAHASRFSCQCFASEESSTER